MVFINEQRFSHLPAYKKLMQLAKNPADLTDSSLLTPERIKNYTSSAAGYKLFYGLERVTDQILSELKNLAEQSFAVKKMQMMQSGETVNFIHGVSSENRQALHTALRDHFGKPKTEEPASLAKQEIKKLKSFINQLDGKNHFTDLCVVGIGGSDLGPRAHYLALKYLQKPNRSVHFISNIDPDDAASVLKGLDLSTTLVAVISKSGTTVETATNEEILRAKFLDAGLLTKNHFIAITGKSSPMDNEKRYLKCFYIWDWVGGRYSTSSMVGGLLIAFGCGFDAFWQMLEGAYDMDRAALSEDLSINIPLMAALLAIWNRNFFGYPTLGIIPYSQALTCYSAHVQQVEMESNGKSIDRTGQFVNYQTGQVIWGEVGTNSQHSFFQLIHQGTAVIPLEFIGFKKPQYDEDFTYQGSTSQQKLLSNLFAQMIALATGKEDENPNKSFSGNRPSHLLFSDQLTPKTLGALMAFFEHKAAFQGFVWNINSFDQEGVQLGKVLAGKVLKTIKKEQSFPLADAFLDQV